MPNILNKWLTLYISNIKTKGHHFEKRTRKPRRRYFQMVVRIVRRLVSSYYLLIIFLLSPLHCHYLQHNLLRNAGSKQEQSGYLKPADAENPEGSV